jgi:hypothetical protein
MERFDNKIITSVRISAKEFLDYEYYKNGGKIIRDRVFND